MSKKKLVLGALFSVAAFSLFYYAYAATTIGSNVDTDGTLTVDGNSTFGNAATDVNLFTGTLQASTTALFTGASTFYGNVTLGDAFTDTLTVNANASTTRALSVAGDLYVGGNASTTASTGNFNTEGDITLGGGNLVVTTSNSATSTVEVGCIQMYATSTLTAVRLEFHASSTLADSTNGATDGLVVWKYGSCPI